MFSVIATHPDLSWMSQYSQRLPGLPSVAVLSRLADVSDAFRKSADNSVSRGGWTQMLRLAPAEAYTVWERLCGPSFTCDFLLGKEASQAEARRARNYVSRLVRYQGKSRFAAKLTGPSHFMPLGEHLPLRTLRACRS